MNHHYSVREIFDTLQGEGVRAGTRAIFIRLAGCNLWNGRESGRSSGLGACARWCDTDFVRGEPMTSEAIALRAAELWREPLPTPRGSIAPPWVVITGGEPALQLDHALLDALRAEGFRIAVESNGTKRTDALLAVDHLCISPKLGSTLQVLEADELKVVVPGVADPDPDQEHRTLAVPFPAPTRGMKLLGAPLGWTNDDLDELADAGDWDRLFVSPQDGPRAAIHTAQAIAFVKRHPRWRLSVQTHKVLGIP